MREGAVLMGAESTPEGHEQGSDRAGRLRVLIVDDEPDVRRVVRMALERRSEFHVVAEAGDGAEAVSAAQHAQPHLIVLDLDMPRVSGLDALPALRTALPAACVVVLTGLPRERMEPLARSAGAVGFIEKRVPSRQLADELLAVVGLLGAVQGALDERRITLMDDLRAPRLARRFVMDALSQWEVDDPIDTVQLMVSELVTNAVLHGRSRADVAVILTSDVVRVEVHDDGEELPSPRQASPRDVTGRGLDLVSKLASDWGVRPDLKGGKAVWFEIPRRPRSAPNPAHP